jgi:alpha-L-rhamnosidase
MKLRKLYWFVSSCLEVFLILSICISSSIAPEKADPKAGFLKILDLKCEYASNPIGLDVQSPQLSWRMESETRGVLQAAYQVMVSGSQENLVQDKGDIWDSGKINSARSCGVTYQGPALKSRERYYWKVRIWDSNNNPSPWSEPAFFEMGLLKQEDWNSDWIGFAPGRTGQVLYFKHSLHIDKKVQKARAYVSGIGYYEFRINGKKAGDHVLDPSTSDYSKRVYYATYDIADFLEKENAFVVTVGPGWYGLPKLKILVEINYTDGTHENITSNDMRTVTTGPILRSSIYDGEYYDAREEKPDFYTSGIPSFIMNATWGYAPLADDPGGKMISQKVEPVKIVRTINPEIIQEPVPGIYVIDAGQNLAGWASIKVRGQRGTAITLKFAETLYKNGTVNQENLRSAKAQDTYVLKGEAEENWEPAFTYHGFRYIQVEGFPYPPKIGDISVKVVRSSVDPAGKFNCSNELLNRIHKMVVSTEASNLHSIPTDCPQRDERMGWLNDLTVRIEQALYNFDLSRFYSKFIDDIEDTQGEDGRITDTAPYRYGARPADPVSASYLLLALKSYEFYGNEKIVREHYKGLKAWVDYLNSRTEDGIVNYSYYGDWCPPVEFGVERGSISKNTPGLLMSTGYLYYDAKMISRMAAILGNEQEEIYYRNLADKTAEAFNNKYWNESTGGYASNNQACNAFALFLGLVSKERIQRVVDNLVADVKSHDYHLTTGNLCTKYLLEMLSEHGHPDVAYKIVTQVNYPGWGYMLANGATTLWERWEYETGGAMNSHNHPMMGSVDSWFYKYILGILPDIDHPGFEKFTIHPLVFDELKFAEGELNTVKGLIKSAWRKESGSFFLDVTIPGNTTATIYIPANDPKNISEGGKKIEKVKEIKFLKMENGCGVFQLSTGNYHFRSDRLTWPSEIH